MLPSLRLRRSIADGIRAVNLAATVAGVVWAAPAAAHPEYAPSTVSHYIKIDLVAPNELRLAYTVMVGPAPAAAWRRAADANADGKIEDAESRALGERARQAATGAIALTVDGKRVVPEFETPLVGLAGAEVAPSPLSVDLVARVPLAGEPPHTVRFEDAAVEPQLGETEVRVEESPATRLLTSHRGATGEPNEKETRFVFRGQKFSALEDRSITVVFGKGAGSPIVVAGTTRTKRGWWAIGAAALVGALGLLMIVGLIRRRRPGRGSGHRER